jgi:type II secretory pathway pseudopilin PulG
MKALSPHSLVVVSLAVAALLAAGAAGGGPSSPDELVRQGNAAFGRGDFAAAAELYQKAGERSDDPGLATYNLALAKYRLARLAEDGGAGLAEAAALFRCCQAPDDPRRPQALYGQGNCLLHGPAGAGGKNLSAAIGCFERCLSEAAAGSDLAADARQNLELARLRKAQYQPPAGRAEDDGGDDPSRPQPTPRPEPRPGDGGDRSADRGGADGPGSEPGGEDERPGPDGQRGAGPQPGKPLPNAAKDEPLSPGDAEAHLSRAVPRVLQDRRDNRRRQVRPAPEGVPDW